MENDIQVKGPTLAPDKLQEMQYNYTQLKTKGTRDYEDLKAEYDALVRGEYASVLPLEEAHCG